MNLEDILNNAVAAQRAKDMLNSDQLTLGELILKLEAVKNKDLPVVFDKGKYVPVHIGSWRGSYSELAFEYAEGEAAYTVEAILKLLNDTKGATFRGYKGGEFTMGKGTPVWVANYGEFGGYLEPKDDKYEQAVVDVLETPEAVSILTELMNYYCTPHKTRYGQL